MDMLIFILIVCFVLLGLFSSIVAMRSMMADEENSSAFMFYSKAMIICWAIALFGAIGFQMIGK